MIPTRNGATLDIMLLAYMDESHNEDRYWIAALIVPATSAASLTRRLDEVVEKAARDFGTSIRAELHGHELFHGKGHWEPVAGMIRARVGIYEAALEAIADHPVAVIIRGIDIPRLHARYASPQPPHELVLQHLLERINDYARDVHDGAPVLTIADEVNSADAHRRELWLYQRVATPGYRPSTLDHIIDTIHFVPSDASRLIQSADLIAFMHQRRHTDATASAPRDSRSVHATSKLWQIIFPNVTHTHCWHP